MRNDMYPIRAIRTHIYVQYFKLQLTADGRIRITFPTKHTLSCWRYNEQKCENTYLRRYKYMKNNFVPPYGKRNHEPFLSYFFSSILDSSLQQSVLLF